MIKKLPILVLFLAPVYMYCQPSSIPPLHAPAYDMLDRLSILSDVTPPMHSEVRPFNRRDAVQYALALDTAYAGLSTRDRQDLQYIFDDNNEWLPDSSRFLRQHKKPFLKVFYPTRANLFECNTKDFILRANPMVNFELAREQDDPDLFFVNQRGLEVRGEVDRKLFFYTNLVEAQARYPNYVQSWTRQFHAIPNAGFYKEYTPRAFKVSNAYDFNVATAYLGFQISRHVGIQLGHGRQVIGNGYRSLLLSDAGAPYFYLKLDTRVWKFDYQNLFLELSAIPQVDIPDGTRIPRKYAAIHYLNYRVTPKISLGFFEATIFDRSQDFEFQYLNPVILYRTVEGMIGSPDNVLIGLDGHVNLLHRVQLYGQLMLDEFKFSQLFLPDQKGWWANKYGIQAGVKYVNAFGLEHLDLQLEYNLVRPYTYSHYDSLDNYTHYAQPLAHPLWANFKEVVGVVNYRPLDKLSFNFRYMHALLGDNTATQNWGSNPLLDYDSHVQEYGNKIGQGIRANTNLAAVQVSWMLYHNLYADMRFLWRNKNSADDTLDSNTVLYGFGLRMNVWNNNNDF